MSVLVLLMLLCVSGLMAADLTSQSLRKWRAGLVFIAKRATASAK